MLVSYYLLGKVKKAREVIEELSNKFQQNLKYYSTFDEYYIEAVFDEIENNLLMYDQLVRTAARFDSEEYGMNTKEQYVEHLELFSNLLE